MTFATNLELSLAEGSGAMTLDFRICYQIQDLTPAMTKSAPNRTSDQASTPSLTASARNTVSYISRYFRVEAGNALFCERLFCTDYRALSK
jgi:hypothetical protein